MIPGAREQIILEVLQRSNVAPVNELAQMTGVSASTIRRDLERLEERGLITRTYGGAVISTPEQDDAISDVELLNMDEKTAIGRAAAHFVKPGDTVLFDIGSTALAVAREVADVPLTVITASLPVFRLFQDRNEATTILLGGYYAPAYDCFGGPLTAAMVSHLEADVAFLGTSGLSHSGIIRDTTSSQVPVKQAILAHSIDTYLVCDDAKIPGRGAYTASRLPQLAGIVTNTALPPELHALCVEHGVREVVP